MDQQELKVVISALREELQEYFTWIMEEFDYFEGEDQDHSASSLEKPINDLIDRRIESQRMNLWERDFYAFYDHPQHPSLYNLFETEDLEIIHYLEDIQCDHFKIADMLDESSHLTEDQIARYEDSFGVLLASQEKGWMYRLDLCAVCGLVEIWSMAYSPDEIALHSG